MAFQIYLNIAAYYAVLSGMKNFSLFIVGIIMLVFAGMFHIYRHGKTMAKTPPPPPKPITPPAGAKPLPSAPSPAPTGLPASSGKPLSPPPAPRSAAPATQAPPHEATSTKPVSSGAADIAGATNDGRSQKTPSSVRTSSPDTAADLNSNARTTKKLR